MGEWVLIWMIFQSELGTTIIAPPPVYFHDRAACEAVAGKLTETADKGFTAAGQCHPTRTTQQRAD